MPLRQQRSQRMTLFAFSVNDLNVIGAAIATAETTPWECPAAPAMRSRSSLGASPDTRQTTRYWISCEA
jgi:hypothetical protein